MSHWYRVTGEKGGIAYVSTGLGCVGRIGVTTREKLYRSRSAAQREVNRLISVGFSEAEWKVVR